MRKNMINIALCFENDAGLHFLYAELSRCFDLRGIDCNLYCFHNAAALMRGAQRKCFDILFCDMTAEYGLVRLTALNLKKLNPRLVCVALPGKAYTPSAEDCLLEPFYTIPGKSPKQLRTYACLAYEATFDSENNFSYYKRPSYVHIPFSSIKYFVSEGRRVRIACADTAKQDNVFYKKLCDVEALISAKERAFFRIHQSYLINADYVAAYNRSHVILTTGENLPISRYEYYKAIRNHIADKKMRR